MDAHEPVTLEEGDRYPLGPPSLFRDSTAVVQLAVNQLVVGSIPTLGAILCTVRLSVRTLPFQGGKTSSILVQCTKQCGYDVMVT